MTVTAAVPLPAGWTDAVDVGPVVLFRYPDGTVRVSHQCDRPGRQVRCAPALSSAHAVVWSNLPTVTPSILCPDCRLHGWVRAGRWVPA